MKPSIALIIVACGLGVTDNGQLIGIGYVLAIAGVVCAFMFEKEDR